MPTTNDDAIDATCETVAEPPIEPQPCPGPTPLTRSDVLRCARTLAAQVSGLAGLVEQLALTPGKARPEFVRGWRQWCGAYLADAGRLERSIFKAQDEAAKLAGYAKRLAEWRGGVAAELGQAQVEVGVGRATEERRDEPKPIAANSWRRWPLWVIIPGSCGVLAGSYFATRWLFRQLADTVISAGDREQSGEAK